MGVAGAAIATVFSRGVASIIGFYYLFSGKKGIVIHPHDLIPRLADLKKVLHIGVPSAIEQSTLALGFTFMAAVVAQFGTVALASYGIGSRLISILSMPAMGFSMAVSIMVGQNLGAGKDHRAERVGWLSSGAILLILTLGGALAFVFSKSLVSIFIVQEDQAVIEMGSRFIKFIALGMGTFGIRMVLNGVFRGAGDTITSLGFSLLALWGFRIPLALILSSRMGTDGIWLGILLSYVLTPTLALLWFRRGKWKEKSISGRGWEPQKVVEVDPDSDPDG
jgi:putative MATE family efflux protein